MGSRNLSSSFSFAKDILKNAGNKLNEFVDSALTTYEESTGKKLKHGDEGIHLAGGSDFCMDIKRYDQVSPAVKETEQTPVQETMVEETVVPIAVPEEVHIQQTEEVPAIEQVIVKEDLSAADDIVVDEMPSVEHEITKEDIIVADDTVAEDVPAVHEVVIEEIPATDYVSAPVVEEEQFSEFEIVKDGEVSYGGPTGETEFDEIKAVECVPEVFAEAGTSSIAETMPSFHQFTDGLGEGVGLTEADESIGVYVGTESIEVDDGIQPDAVSIEPVEIDDGVDFEDLYESIVADCIVDDIMPRFEAEESERAFVPDYVISDIGSPIEGSTVIDVPLTHVPDYVISEIESPAEGSTVIDVPAVYAPEYVISEIGLPAEETTHIDVPEPVVEVPSVVDHVTSTTSTFRFGFASTSMPGKTGFTFSMGKRNRVDEFINGPKD